MPTRLKLKAKGPPRDAMGRDVRPALAGIFHGRALLVEWCFRLDDLQNQIGTLNSEPYGVDLDMPLIERMIQVLRAQVMIGAPMQECDCPAWERQCPRCEGKRWVSGAGATKARSRLLSS